jgi:hypothetical protein
MRSITCILGLAGLAGAGVMLHIGCGTAYEDIYLPLTDPALADAGTDGNAACSGDPTKDAAIVSDACGVFVSATAPPGGDGKQATPFQTFAEAAAAKPARVFACAGSYAETVQVSFSGGVEVYGGFTGCTGTSWTWSASASAEITTAANAPGVMLDGGANVFENVSVTAPGATMAGGSSIALVVNGGSFAMTNGALAAGDAQDGTAGANGNAMNLEGTTGASGANACDVGTTHPGPIGMTNTCVTGGSSTAGNGGDGGQIVSNMLEPAVSGTDGNAMPAATPLGTADGKGGSGEGQGGAPLCANGDNGAPGSAGISGEGATAPGVIAASGYQGAPGKDGTGGTPGQGGGGGGGAKGGISVLCGSTTTSVPGASGGAGGTGGCGGAFGAGGMAGGSSIALLVLDAQVTLTSVTLTAGKGGHGGAGGNGQSGGASGGGGANGAGGPVNNACSGGAGGKGGSGGPGGGGQGGHSLGIAFQGTTAPTGGTITIQMTNAGSGGMGGTNNTAANMGQGANGMAANCWDFAANAMCK